MSGAREVSLFSDIGEKSFKDFHLYEKGLNILSLKRNDNTDDEWSGTVEAKTIETHLDSLYASEQFLRSN